MTEDDEGRYADTPTLARLADHRLKYLIAQRAQGVFVRCIDQMGRGQAVKARDFESRIRRFESFRPSQIRDEVEDVPTHNGELKLFSGSAHPALAQEIVERLGGSLGRACLKRFSDGEVSFQIDENIRGTDVFVLQPTCTPVDEHLVELCVMIDAFRRSSAARITAVIPYYGYARQDRKDKPRVPITAKLVANLLGAAGANRVLTMDLHKAQIQGFFDIPVDHLFAAPIFIDHLTKMHPGQEVTIVSPDAGGVERARAYAKRLDADLAIIDKRRSEDGHAEVMHVVGDVRDKLCIIQDDIVDTAGTLQQASKALRANGASQVVACAVHGVLSGPAMQRIEDSELEQVIVTNTIPPRPESAASKKIHVLSVAPLLGRAIQSIHQETSVSSLFV